MRKIVAILLVMVIAGLSGCSLLNDNPETTLSSVEQPVETTPTESVLPTHSELFLSTVPPDEMINYFNEVALSMEYSTGAGDVTLVQKWEIPILYRIEGTPTEEDLSVLQNLFAQLNAVEGFPGIGEAKAGEENLIISFLNEDAFNQSFSGVIQGEAADGAVQFWYYNDSNEIYTGRIGYRTDIGQETRNSVLVEEIINLLGFNYTTCRPDSIIYQYSSDVAQPSNVDWVLVKLLYHPLIRCGMTAEDCLPILQQLYY